MIDSNNDDPSPSSLVCELRQKNKKTYRDTGAAAWARFTRQPIPMNVTKRTQQRRMNQQQQIKLQCCPLCGVSYPGNTDHLSQCVGFSLEGKPELLLFL